MTETEALETIAAMREVYDQRANELVDGTIWSAYSGDPVAVYKDLAQLREMYLGHMDSIVEQCGTVAVRDARDEFRIHSDGWSTYMRGVRAFAGDENV